MAEFLSPEWVAELDGAARRSPALAGPAGDEPLTVEQRVRGGPPGDVRYHVVLADGGVRFVYGPAPEPDVLLVIDYAFAAEMHRGRGSAQDALAAGALKVRGDLDRLLARSEALLAIDDVFAAVRASTTFPAATGAAVPPLNRR